MSAEARTAGSAAPAPASALRMVGWCTAVLLIASALLPLAPRMAAREALVLEVSGDLVRVDADSVRGAVVGLLHRDFDDIDLAAVKAAVEQLPWVARARVERAWPDTVRVQVREHRAVARWGAQGLVSDRDVVFTPSALAADLESLPRLEGPPGQQAEVRGAFEALRAQLAGTPFVPAQLGLNARGEWTAVTAEGLELRLGRGVPTDAVDILAGPARTALEGRLTEVSYVDLHYINGFAVGWREPGPDATRGSGAAGGSD